MEQYTAGKEDVKSMCVEREMSTLREKKKQQVSNLYA